MAELRKKIRLLLTLLVVFLVLLILRLSVDHFLSSNSAAEQRAALIGSPYPVLFAHGIRDDWISGDGINKVVRVPRDLAVEQIYAALVSRFLQLGGRCLRAEKLRDSRRRVIQIGFQDETLFQISLVPDSTIRRRQGRVAIVVAGLGRSFNTTVKSFLQLEQTVSMSVLPGLKYSRAIAEATAARGLEVVAYFVVEPAGDGPAAREFSLSSQMKADEVTRRVRLALRALPEARSAVCDAGDAARDSPRDALIIALDQHDLVVIDRPGAETRACTGTVGGRGRCFALDFDVDEVDDESEIQNRLGKLARLAAQQGVAVGLVRPRNETLRVLQSEMTVLRKKGVQFVGISDLAR